MKNKKMLILLVIVLAAVLAIGAALAVGSAKKAQEAAQQEADALAAQEETVELAELAGEITEVTDAYFVLADGTMGEVQVNIGDDTQYEGVEASELAAGQYAVVIYDGKLTRSLPPQAYALRVGVYAVSGTVTALGEGSVTIAREELGDEVIVFLPEGAPELTVGDAIVAYTNGAMTMSLPAQTTAIGVVKN